MKSLKFIGKHPLIHFLLTDKGNPKALILSDILWAVPFQLFAPFVTLYMFQQGIDDIQIGLLLTITMVGQVIFALFGGIITDKIGRLPATLIADTVSWSLAAFIWAISHNFWLFALAALVNSTDRIANTSWQCLLVEDANPNDLLGIYSWIHIIGLAAVFFTPISGLLIGRFSLVPVVRNLYTFLGISMIIRLFITWKFCVETKQGLIRKAETKYVSVGTMLREYGHVVPKMFRSSATVKMVAISSILHVTMMVNGSFFSLYITTKLGVEERFLSVFPLLNAVVILLFLFVIQHRIAYIKDKIPLWIGLVIYAICHVSLILFPANRMFLIVIFLLFVAVGNALVGPRLGAMLQLAIDAQERARIMGLVQCFTIAFAAPFGFFAGFLSGVDRRLPFVLTSSLFVIALIVVSRIKDEEFKIADQ